MADIKNKFGELVYRIEGDRIMDVYGNWLYTIVDDRINDTYGNWKYNIRGEDLFDTYGNRIGAMNDLADILPSPRETNTGSSSDHTPRRREKEKLEGFWAYFWAFVGFLIWPFINLWHHRGYTALRSTWWGTLFRMAVFFIVLTLILGGIGIFDGDNTFAQIIAGIIWIGLPMLPITIFSIKRMQDIGRPWWWILVPGANLIMCGFFPGKD